MNYYYDNLDLFKEKSKTKYWENVEVEKEKCKEYRERNKAKLVAIAKAKRQTKEYKEYVKNYKDKNPLIRVQDSLRGRLSEFCRGKYKKPNTMSIVGCSLEELRNHLEQQFQENMSWDNYGDWHVDHIVPMSIAQTKEEVFKLNHFSNLQPLWAIDNILKYNKILDEELKERLLGSQITN